MTDSRYTYERVNAIKIIIQSTSSKILLLQEPETNAWMPLHWGFPGGKPLAKESLLDAFKRKLREELGADIKPEGIVKIEELLQGEKTVIMYHLFAKSENEFIPVGEAKTYKWLAKEEIEKMRAEDFTEFFNKKLLISLLDKMLPIVPTSIIETENYNELIEKKDLAYEKWFNSGKK